MRVYRASWWQKAVYLETPESLPLPPDGSVTARIHGYDCLAEIRAAGAVEARRKVKRFYPGAKNISVVEKESDHGDV